jgi:hypothetical protein
MLPGYGCNLEELLFSPLNLTLKTYVIDLIKTAILYHEPRIDVKKIDIDITEELNGILHINIDYIIRSTNSRMNMVFPFYKEEVKFKQGVARNAFGTTPCWKKKRFMANCGKDIALTREGSDQNRRFIERWNPVR